MNKPIDFIKSERYSKMFRLVWEDGTISEDIFNRTRASDYVRNWHIYEQDPKTAQKL